MLYYPMWIRPSRLLRVLSQRGGRVMGLDVGDRFVGVAVSDESNTVARGIKTLEKMIERKEFSRRAPNHPGGARRPLREKDINTFAKEFERLMKDNKVFAVVVGLPNHVDGSLSEQSRRTSRFVTKLLRYSPYMRRVPLYWQDESHSSQLARETLSSRGIRAATRQKKVLDAVSAEHILQRFLTRHAAS
uniref:YqgF/RNase H-like domain-containing protein n=1 Tax=Lotharella oceanica TaxID=641309 RepID=A0A7S2X6F2_9EUKA|mmetsp:Transcript_10567/g.20270  ORF Transcript_10567/g.20270 Transcript_10567/m.20270 type:complete len:189 (+) Transcript_10567:9-575(+)